MLMTNVADAIAAVLEPRLQLLPQLKMKVKSSNTAVYVTDSFRTNPP
jgi:hypothetical protein